MKKFLLCLCSIGLHRWIYETNFDQYDNPKPKKRRCKRCRKLQEKYLRTTTFFKIWFTEEEIRKQWDKEDKGDAFINQK